MLEQLQLESKRDWALWYAADLGWPVFPVWWTEDGRCACGEQDCPSPGKHPNHLQVRNGCSNATSNIEQVDLWWTRAGHSNIGMSTDHHPVLDLDCDEAILFVEQHISPGTQLPRVRTGRGGMHLHMEPHSEIRNSTDLGGVKGLDVRGAGGYVLIPPGSNSAGDYEWLMRPDSPLLPWPDELLGFVLDAASRRKNGKLTELFGHRSLANHPGAIKTQRNSELCRLVGIELARGADPNEVLVEAEAWGQRCQPPYSPRQIQKTVGSLAVKHNSQEATSAPSKAERKKGFAVIDLETHDPEPIEWLWPNWLPLGALVFVNGDPEAGKTWLCCDFAARITNKQFWPDGAACNHGKVLYCSAEDSADVIKSRIAACGGDLSRVLIPLCGEHGDETGLLLSHYLEDFESVLRENPDIRLVVIDTISAMLPNVDFHKLEQVQRGCQVLKVLAKRYNVTIAALHHLPKDAGKRSIIHAASGSVGFTAAPRAAVLVAVEPRTERRILFPQKMSWGKKPAPRAYSIENGQVAWEVEAASITWEQLHAPQRTGRSTDRARDWLQNRLAGSPVLVRVLEDECEDLDFSWSTAKRAAGLLGVDRSGRMDNRTWSLPQADQPSSSAK